MSHGAIVVHTVGLASNTTLTSSVDLGRAWRNVYLEIPTMTSGTDVLLKASPDNSTFRRVYDRTNSATAQANVFTVKSAVTQAIVDIPAGLRYVAIELSTAMTATSAVFRVICSD
jgi:hypothetical protein